MGGSDTGVLLDLARFHLLEIWNQNARHLK